MKNTILCLLIVLYSQCYSQTLPYTEITIKQGLPNSKIHYTYNDNNGYLWICTDNGLARWDGRNFKTYTVKDGLPSNSIYRVFEDSRFRLWISTFSKELCFIKDNKVFSSEQFPSLQNIPIEFGASNFEFDSFLYFFNRLEYGKINYYSKFHINDTLFKNIKRTDATKVLNSVIDQYMKGSINSNFTTDNYIKDLTLKNFSNNEIFKGIYNSKLITLDIKNNEYKLYNKDLVCIKKLNNKSIHNGVLRFGELEFKPKFIQIKTREQNYKLNIYSNYYAYEDKEDNLYLLNKHGLAQVKTKKIVSQKYTDYEFKNILICDNQVYLTSLNKILNLTLGKEYILKDKEQASDEVIINDIIKQNDELILTTTSYGKYYLNIKNHKISRNRDISFPSNKNLFKINDSEHLSSFSRNAIYVNSSGAKNIFNDRAYSMLIDSKNRLWISTMLDIRYTYFDKTKLDNLIYSSLRLDKSKNVFVNNIIEAESDQIIFSSNTGLFLYYKNQIYSCPFLANLFCYKAIYNSKDKTLWVATDKGLFHLSIQNNLKIKFNQLEVYREVDGLLSDDIKSVAIKGDSIYALSSDGYSIVNTKLPRWNQYKIPLLLDYISINDSNIGKNKTIFSYKDNVLNFNFSAIYFKRNSRLLFDYVLEGEKKINLSSEKDYIEFIGLPAGEYTLKVQAFDRDLNNVKSDWLYYKFEIEPPFWKSNWFIGLISLLTILLSYFGIRYYLNTEKVKLKKEHEVESLISGLKLQSLRAQMNPHFMFNCLNSIKDFLYKKDFEATARYLSKFASLIRMSLNMSRSNYVYLSDEIKFLDNYCLLEKMRFSDQFDYKIENLAKLGSDIELPTMMIQPFVENSIRHGLIGSLDYRGEIIIKFENSESKLICTIEDNGIGYIQGLELKKNKINEEESKALTIFEERIDLYNKTYDKNITYHICDKSSENRKGTRVTLTMDITND